MNLRCIYYWIIISGPVNLSIEDSFYHIGGEWWERAGKNNVWSQIEPEVQNYYEYEIRQIEIQIIELILCIGLLDDALSYIH